MSTAEFAVELLQCSNDLHERLHAVVATIFLQGTLFDVVLHCLACIHRERGRRKREKERERERERERKRERKREKEREMDRGTINNYLLHSRPVSATRTV